jgi:SAM-dependent methyltransferase
VTERLRVEEGTYLPPADDTWSGRWFRLYLRLSYRTWRRALARFAPRPAPGTPLRVLDCGCGPGFLLRFCRDWFPHARVVGLDLDRQSLRYARNQVPGASVLQAALSGSRLPVADRSCHVVFSLHVVEHLDDPDAFLREVARVLAPGGLLALATPNPAGLGARVMRERWMGLRPDHVSLRPPDAWRAAIEAAGFRVQRDGTTGLTGLPLFHHTPLALLNWAALFLRGFFPWRQGEAYVCLATRTP